MEQTLVVVAVVLVAVLVVTAYLVIAQLADIGFGTIADELRELGVGAEPGEASARARVSRLELGLVPHDPLIDLPGVELCRLVDVLAEIVVGIVEGQVEQVEADASGLTGVVLAGGGHLALDAVVVAPRVEARAELLEPLGLTPVEVLLGEHPIGTRIEADRTGATAVPGVWVAGNLTDPQAQVIGAAAAGLTAGAAINLDLVFEQARSRG